MNCLAYGLNGIHCHSSGDDDDDDNDDDNDCDDGRKMSGRKEVKEKKS